MRRRSRAGSSRPVDALGALVLGAACLAAALLGVAAVAVALAGLPAVSVSLTPTTPRVAQPPPSCASAAPSTAAGYTALFASLDTAAWGAGDVAISVPVGLRSVWLFGDTFSAGRFVHSSAITQYRGCLHVSAGGAQLLPNDDATHIYWVQSATVSSAAPGRQLVVRARAVVLTGTGGWDFRDGGFSRDATTALDAAGDLTFISWGPRVFSPVPDPGPMYVYGAHHFGYGRLTHPELALASGLVLVSVSQNWDDGTLHGYPDYRPTFSEARR